MIAIGSYKISTSGKKEKFVYRIHTSKIDISITMKHIPEEYFKLWDKKHKRFKYIKDDTNNKEEIDNTNLKLYLFSKEISNLITSEDSSNLKFTTKWLREEYEDFFNLTKKENIIAKDDKDPEFKIYYDEYIMRNKCIDDGNNGKNLKPNTLKGYKTMYNYWCKFTESQNRQDFKLSEIDLTIFDNFIQIQESKFHLSKNSIVTNSNKFKAILSHAYKKKKNVSHDFVAGNFNYHGENTNEIYLNDEEITNIIELNIPDELKHLEISRSWFVIQLFSGVRISDLFSLNSQYVNDDFLEITTTKTNSLCVIPLFNPIKNILNKYNGEFPPVISQPLYNKNIKEISKLAGITNLVKGSLVQRIKFKNKDYIRRVKDVYPKYMLVSSHTCRRSLLTNLSKKDIPLNNLTSISGHSNVKTLENYIQTSIHEKSKAIKDKLASMEGFY